MSIFLIRQSLPLIIEHFHPSKFFFLFSQKTWDFTLIIFLNEMWNINKVELYIWCEIVRNYFENERCARIFTLILSWEGYLMRNCYQQFIFWFNNFILSFDCRFGKQHQNSSDPEKNFRFVSVEFNSIWKKTEKASLECPFQRKNSLINVFSMQCLN